MGTKPKEPTESESFAAPWMKIALQELNKNVGEHDAPKEFRENLYLSLAANDPHGPTLLDWKAIDHEIAQHASDVLGSTLMLLKNAPVRKYLDTVRTDPDLDKKRRSFALDPVRKNGSEWRMTAWCAAFVNWCLTQAKVPHLGYATAASWLKFGMAMAHPQYGCVVVISPSQDTGSTTGHVAFFGGWQGKDVWLLGGNQHRKVSWMRKNKEWVRGYRWPAIVGDFESPRDRSGLALA
jgi:uncharacterized protein (TIGR02594 family)